jgi:hypothetical protein
MENALPTAAFTISGDLVASSPITLDASTSSDPDPGDTLSSYQWSVSSTDAACEPPVIAGTAKTAQVRFGCGGNWDVKLIVFDGKQAQSAPTVHTLAIGERTGPALVAAGEDLTVGHVCAGSSPSCTTDGEVQLSATLNSEATLTVRWTVQAPAGLPLDATRRVRFDPSATALNPKAVIETDGTAISGDWVFRVEALNGEDVLAYDTMRVSVTNRAPTITGAQPSPFPHGYVASSQFFVANGSIPVQVVDPDGDPLTRAVAVHHSGDGESAFTATDSEASIGVSIMVPGAHPEWLIAETNPSRVVTLNAVDVNGAAATETAFAVTVANRRPMSMHLLGGTAPHTFDRTEREYVSTPSLAQYADPDGDPLDHQVTANGASAADCPTSTLLSDGTVQLHCARVWTSASDLASFTVSRTATVEVWDPWPSQGHVRETIGFRIGNRAPSASSIPSVTARATCSAYGGSTYCGSGGSGSPAHANLFPGASGSVTLYDLGDPDGDPLQVIPDASVAGARGSTCSGTQQCTLGYTVPAVEYCGNIAELPATTISFVATDGASPVTLSLTVQSECK